jgi:PAS domain S-box-containing protein
MADEILGAIPDILYAFDTSGRLIWWNDRVTEITGYTDAEIEEMHPLDFVADRDKEGIAAAIASVIDQQTIEPREGHLVTKDDEQIPYEFTGAPLTDDDGSVWGVAGVGRNIATRKRFERVSDGFCALDTDWRFTYLNSRGEALIGRPEEDLLGTVIWEAFPEVVDTRVYEEFHTAMETQAPVSFDQYFPALDAWFDVRAYPSETGLSVYVREITDRKERERELEQYRTLTEAANDGIITIDEDSTIRAANPAVEDIFGYPPDDLLGEPLTRLMPDELAADHQAALQQYLDTGERSLEWSNVELPGTRADGSDVPLSISFSESTYDGQRFFTGIVRDITDRKERERQLAYRKALLEAQAETTIHGLLLVGPDREVLYHNERFLELWDIPKAVAATRSDETLLEYVHDRLADPEEFVEAVEYLYDNPTEESRDTIELADGRYFDRYSSPVVSEGTHYGRLWIFQDITDRKERERQLEQQRAALTQLDQFNTLVRDLVYEVVEKSTRTEIERTVCDQLVASEFYRAAWIGERSRTAAELTPRVWAGIDPDTASEIAAATGSESPQGLTARAAETREVRVAAAGTDGPAGTAHLERHGTSDLE